MDYRTIDLNFKKLLSPIDWKLLLFLILFLDVKLAVKVLAILLIYVLRPNFKFGLNFKNPRLPLFYVLIIGLSFIPFVFNGNYAAQNYLPVFIMGITLWVLCLLAVHQVRLSIENNSIETIQHTVVVFFVINAALSFLNLAHIMWETGTINPYTYQGENQKYFIGTGDYIRGLTFDTSTANAVLNAFGVIYFLDKKKPVMVLLCMTILLLTGSNFTNVVLMAILFGQFIFKSTRDQKSLIAICLMLLVVFMAKISPQNDKYLVGSFQNLISPPNEAAAANTHVLNQSKALTPGDIKRKAAQRYIDSICTIKPKLYAIKEPPVLTQRLPNYHGRVLIVGPDINKPPYLTPTDTTPDEQRLLTFIDEHKANLPIAKEANFKRGLPGKVTGALETLTFMQHEPAKLIAGDGIGNFSSKMAFRATGLGFEGEYPQKYAYISKDFLSNHLDIYLNFFSRRSGLHSLTNSPNSVYDQLLAEYGLLGLGVFLVFYLGFFMKQYKYLTYGLPLLLLLMAAFAIDYWFEQLSVVVFFELLLLLNIKETKQLKPAYNGIE